jgi:hypothetical protein
MIVMMHIHEKKSPATYAPVSKMTPAFANAHSTAAPSWERALGSAPVVELKLPIQTKLTVNQPGDAFEQEADQVADQVMRLPAPRLQRAQCACGGAAGPDGECAACKQKRLAGLGLSRAAMAAPANTPHLAPPIVQQTLQAPGQPLDATTRSLMEARFGMDFGGVRVHTNEQAAASAKAVNARAYTVGQNVVFGAGEYEPNTLSGRRLLAHELSHTLQQARTTRPAFGVQRQQQPCTRRFTRAANFTQYITLVREAETRLAAAGYTSAEDRIHVLRGIYYGTTWSADYLVERSAVRKLGFQTYTASTTPDDPRPHLPCGLFEALRTSQDLADGGRHVDAGHLMIGLDARRSWTPRNVPIPSQGGTGLELSTWLGDLGGGAGMLAYRRVTDPGRRVMTVFSGTDFGGSINLEGDIAGFIVGRNTSTTPSGAVPLAIPAGGTIADALQTYLLPPSGGSALSSPEWNSRCTTFLQMRGGTFDTSGALTNRVALINAFKGQIQDFACWYLVNRLRQTSRLSLTTLRAASLHIPTTAEEVATVFVDALNDCHIRRRARLEATGPGPAPMPASANAPTPCQIAIRALEAAEQGGRLLQEGGRQLRDLRRNLPF